MNEKQNLKHLCGASVADDGFGDLHDISDVIKELESFVDQFSTHAMSDEVLRLRGQKEAYEDVIEYLRRVRNE